MKQVTRSGFAYAMDQAEGSCFLLVARLEHKPPPSHAFGEAGEAQGLIPLLPRHRMHQAHHQADLHDQLGKDSPGLGQADGGLIAHGQGV